MSDRDDAILSLARSMYLADGGRNWDAETDEVKAYWMRRAALRGRL